MPKTLKSVSKNYSYNTRYTINPKRLESIIRLLEDSKDNLNKPCAVHIVMLFNDEDREMFDRKVINKVLKKVFKELDTRLWLLHC